MRKFLKIGILAATAMIVVPAAVANQGQAPEWWLVIDDNNAQSAHFVDLASMAQSGGAVQVSALTLDRNGHHEARTLNVDCSRGQDGGPAVTNFLCGSEEYRSENGLILGPVSPDEMAQTLFATQSVSAPIRGFHEA